jgi:uncharacterized protein (DUF58 family)
MKPQHRLLLRRTRAIWMVTFLALCGFRLLTGNPWLALMYAAAALVHFVGMTWVMRRIERRCLERKAIERYVNHGPEYP